MRDWRNDATARMDTDLIDIISATQRLLDADQSFELISGYRSPETNAMLRKRSSGVAKRSYHLKGQAADLRMKGRSVNQVSHAARTAAAGGVGRYSGSNFTHVDSGPLRSWGS